MHMTIQQILREKGLSRYQLSKRSGIPWATLATIIILLINMTESGHLFSRMIQTFSPDENIIFINSQLRGS